jgi:hypothetical protein
LVLHWRAKEFQNSPIAWIILKLPFRSSDKGSFFVAKPFLLFGGWFSPGGKGFQKCQRHESVNQADLDGGSF